MAIRTTDFNGHILHVRRKEKKLPVLQEKIGTIITQGAIRKSHNSSVNLNQSEKHSDY